jgi:hypothetical protein
MHIEFLLEEPSAEALLRGILPKLLPVDTSFAMAVFQGKIDLLAKLGSRLRGYRKWIPADWRIAVLLDEDREDCFALKAKMEAAARTAGFPTKSRPGKSGGFSVLNRISVEEIEAWIFGDVPALRSACPKASPFLARRAAFRDPDAIAGGTWEALERELQRAGCYGAGLPKIEVARTVAPCMDPARNTSRSFQCFTSGLAALQTSFRVSPRSLRTRSIGSDGPASARPRRAPS